MKLNMLLLISFAVAMTACNHSPKDNSASPNHDVASADTMQMGPDSAFLSSAYTTGIFEIKIANLANQKSSTAEVKSLADMMIKDHTDLNGKISTLAKAKDISLSDNLPDELQKKYDNLSNLTGKKFDQEYADINVKGHEGAINDFQKEASGNGATDVKDLATNALPNLKMHKEHSEMLQKQLGGAM